MHIASKDYLASVFGRENKQDHATKVSGVPELSEMQVFCRRVFRESRETTNESLQR